MILLFVRIMPSLNKLITIEPQRTRRSHGGHGEGSATFSAMFNPGHLSSKSMIPMLVRASATVLILRMLTLLCVTGIFHLGTRWEL
ncbi:MAG: hypothetical protein OXH57_02255 [Ekhidna sp.]|nr:hypothetical protein [Ekhidna sp.]